MVPSRIEMFLSAREDAARRGDRNMVRSLNADLARLGHVDAPVVETVQTAETVKTTQAPVLETPETPAAAPRNRGGRRPLPRCEHNKIVGRCPLCAASPTA